MNQLKIIVLDVNVKLYPIQFIFHFINGQYRVVHFVRVRMLPWLIVKRLVQIWLEVMHQPVVEKQFQDRKLFINTMPEDVAKVSAKKFIDALKNKSFFSFLFVFVQL